MTIALKKRKVETGVVVTTTETVVATRTESTTSEDYEAETDVTTPEDLAFIPPSLPSTEQDAHETYTYLTAVPEDLASDMAQPCILGVDEAGRGPVLGPMVYAVAYCPVAYREILAKDGFMDSKVLTHEVRSRLLEKMCAPGAMKRNIGWATTIMTARDISHGMLRPPSVGPYNLNDQAHDTTMALIQKVLDAGVNVTEAFVDTVGPPAKYQDKLSQRFPTIKFTVTKKADSIYPIVSAASICAKVTRDASLVTLDESAGEWGSGYPSDPRTASWLKTTVDSVFGWSQVVRFSWQTTRDVLDKQGCAPVDWPEDLAAKKAKNPGFYAGQTQLGAESAGTPSLMAWFGAALDTL